jgi:hypothetical protein
VPLLGIALVQTTALPVSVAAAIVPLYCSVSGVPLMIGQIKE